MSGKKRFSPRSLLYILAILLLFPALFINLGLLAFIDDEAIRSLVALEMKLSGNLVTPTLHGQYYYNKPPLFNWILLLFFELSGRINEFVARMPTNFALLGYGATIFYFFRKHYGNKIALLNALLLITCGRILFWDAILGLIDISFSWLVFCSFMVIYHQFEKGNFFKLFLYSYLLTSAGFLMKGLPALLFQAITLLVYFTYKRQFKRLFSLSHVAGVLSFLLVAGGYYLLYRQYHSLEPVFNALFSESSKRTITYSIWKTILHFFTFPLEMVYHFLPWSLFVIYFIRKDALRWIRNDPFVTFNMIVFLANILIYWVSPGVFPRYLLMLAPLIFSTFLYFHIINEKKNSRQFKVIDKLFFGVIILVTLGSFAPLFLDRTQGVPHLYLKTFGISLALLALSFAYQKLRTERLLLLALFLLVFRIGFNIFVLPDRNSEDFGNLCRATTVQIGKAFAEKDLYIYKSTVMQPTNSFYLTKERQQIVRRKYGNFDLDALYIIDPKTYPDVNYEKVGEFLVRHGKLTYDIRILKN